MKPFLFSAFFSVACLMSFAQSLSLDPNFGMNGIVNTPMGGGSVIQAMAIQNDGKIVAGGTSTNGGNSVFAIARYNANGSLDNTFNMDGKLTTSIGSDAEAFAIAIQSDGKIVAAGYMYNDSTWEFALARYNIDGTLDNTFGTDGITHTAIGSIDDEINDICIQADGKIVAVGYTNVSLDPNNFIPQVAVVRYNTNGSPDNTFNGNGIVISGSGYYDVGNSVALQIDGKIVIGGTDANVNDYEFLVIRYNTDGSLDNTFNGTGTAITTISTNYDAIHSIAIQSDGKIVASGISGNGTLYDMSLARYNSDGSLDNSFNGDGKVITPIGTFFDVQTSMAIDSNGKILVASGFSPDAAIRDVDMLRYNRNGSLDNSFGTSGRMITDVDSLDVICALKLFNSRTYVAGTNNDFFLVGYTNTFVLAVDLLSFTAALQNNSTRLEWEMNGTSNTSLFKIERSSDGRNFINIGELPNAGQGQTNYLFIDSRPLQELNFYRLKMVNADGRFNYSNVVLVKLNTSNITMKIFPNPATDLLQVWIPSAKNETITLQISDAAGKIMRRELLTSIGTNQSVSVDVSILPAGTYFLFVKSSRGTQAEKFIKQ